MSATLPKLSKESLEELLIAVCNLKDEKGRAVIFCPHNVLTKSVLAQIPEPVLPAFLTLQLQHLDSEQSPQGAVKLAKQ